MIKPGLILIFLAMVSCKSVAILPEQKTLESIVIKKLGEHAVMQKNKDASFALYSKQNSSTLSVSYIIIKLSDLSLVEEGNVPRAAFAWIDTYKIEIREVSGITSKLDQPKKNKIIDVTKYISKL